MALYVDGIKYRVPANPKKRFIGKRFGQKWARLFADTVAELHAAAEKVGLQKELFNDHKSFPHYDVSPKRRAALIEAGAKQMKEEDIIRQIILKKAAELESRVEVRQTGRFTAEVKVHGAEEMADLIEAGDAMLDKASPTGRNPSEPEVQEVPLSLKEERRAFDAKPPDPCQCGHAAFKHGRMTDGPVFCGEGACDCQEYRPKREEATPDLPCGTCGHLMSVHNPKSGPCGVELCQCEGWCYGD